MNGLQKGVKIFALVLAGIIIFSILSGITYGISFLFRSDFSSHQTIDFEKTFENVENIEIDVRASSIFITTGEDFTVKGYDVSDHIQVNQKGTILKIEEDSFGWFQFYDGQIEITIPEDTILENFDISAGAGKIKIEGISSSKADFQQGAGLFCIENSTFQDIHMEGGAGKIEVKNSQFHDLELEAGVGEVQFNGLLTGNNEISCGVGRVSLMIEGSQEDYRLQLEKGLGSIHVDGESISSDTVLGRGSNTIAIEGGVGSIEVNFQ